MQLLTPPFAHALKCLSIFSIRTLKHFSENQGLLLAAAIAYYALLSLIPLLVLIVITLSHLINQAELIQTLSRYLEWLIPGQSKAIVGELSNFIANRDVIGWVLLGTMLFFSSLAFSILEKAMSIIFRHRMTIRSRHFLVSALLPYCYMLFLGLALLFVTLISIELQNMGEESIVAFGHHWGLGHVSGLLLYILGLASEVFLLTAIYLVIPVGRTKFHHAFIGGSTMAILWEMIRHLLAWYFSTLSQASIVYGSLTTAIIVLLSLEVGATLLLLGAQVISEYEKGEVAA